MDYEHLLPYFTFVPSQLCTLVFWVGSKLWRRSGNLSSRMGTKDARDTIIPPGGLPRTDACLVCSDSRVTLNSRDAGSDETSLVGILAQLAAYAVVHVEHQQNSIGVSLVCLSRVMPISAARITGRFDVLLRIF
jgi:hypothetical protein